RTSTASSTHNTRTHKKRRRNLSTKPNISVPPSPKCASPHQTNATDIHTNLQKTIIPQRSLPLPQKDMPQHKMKPRTYAPHEQTTPSWARSSSPKAGNTTKERQHHPRLPPHFPRRQHHINPISVPLQ
ncbi:hypothetical protein M758_8G156200, partial [Ceratodon purpureus]